PLSLPTSTDFPYTTLFRSLLPMQRPRREPATAEHVLGEISGRRLGFGVPRPVVSSAAQTVQPVDGLLVTVDADRCDERRRGRDQDRKSTRLNSSHVKISYA